MQDNTWSLPVRVETKDGEYKSVQSPEEALDCLVHEWPVDDGRFLADAKRICAQAVEAQEPTAAARDAFVSASLEAFLRIH